MAADHAEQVTLSAPGEKCAPPPGLLTGSSREGPGDLRGSTYLRHPMRREPGQYQDYGGTQGTPSRRQRGFAEAFTSFNGTGTHWYHDSREASRDGGNGDAGGLLPGKTGTSYQPGYRDLGSASSPSMQRRPRAPQRSARSAGGGRPGVDISEEELDRLPIHRGLVVSLRESFGFIQCIGREDQIFFHVSELHTQDDRTRDVSHFVQIETEVEFVIVDGLNRSGRPLAKRLQILPKGTICMTEFLEGTHRGTVREEPRGRRRDSAVGGVIAVHQEKDAEATEKESGPPPDRQPGTDDDPPTSVRFGTEDISVESDGSRGWLRVNDEVEFRIGYDWRRMEYKATDIALVRRPSPQRVDSDGAKGKDDSIKYETGKLVTLKPSYGFIKCAERDARLFFHYSTCRTPEAELNVDDDVEFLVARDPRSQKIVATDVLTLPPGTVQFHETLEGRFSGVVRRGLTLGPQKGHSEGEIMYHDEEDAEVIVCFSHQDMANPRERLCEEDEVEFTLVLEKRTGKLSATEIKTTKKRADKRELGVVVRRTDKYGFIRCCERDSDVFFHISELRDTDRGPLDVDQNVEFTVITDPRTGRLNAIDILCKEKGTAVFDTVEEERRVGLCTKRLGDTRDSRKDAKGQSVADGAVEYDTGGETLSLPFRRGDSKPKEPYPREGDYVEFSVATEKRNGRTRATLISLRRFSGVVKESKSTSGSIEYQVGEHTETIFYHANEVIGGSSLHDGDEVEFAICKSPTSGQEMGRKIRRTKEAPVPVNDRKYKANGDKLVTFVLAKGPDGTRGFAAGRGRPLVVAQGTVGEAQTHDPGMAESDEGECVKPATDSACEDAVDVTLEGVSLDEVSASEQVQEKSP
mmetsp:Transcript_7075/g.26024  ORF Transcript_7075/g.26024 Transcript_7075/m.26024 type:complete len:862 (-) Transcript_7075:135-2720(-)